MKKYRKKRTLKQHFYHKLVCPWRGHDFRGCDTGAGVGDGYTGKADLWCKKCDTMVSVLIGEVYELRNL